MSAWVGNLMMAATTYFAGKRYPQPLLLLLTLDAARHTETKRNKYHPTKQHINVRTLRTRVYKSVCALPLSSAVRLVTPSWYLRMAFNSFWTSEDLRMSWSISASVGLMTSGSLSLFRKPA